MSNTISYSLLRRRLLFVALSLLTILTVAGYQSGPAEATNSSVVTIFSDGAEKTVSIEAETVELALEKADVEVGEHDLVEPSLDTEINDAVFRINVYRARPVTIVDGDKTRKIQSPYRSERLIAADAGIKVYDEDRFTLEQVQDILDSGFVGQRLTIIRATPVEIDLYGTKITHRTHSETVSEVLAERGIKLKDNDKVVPAKDAKISTDKPVRVVHVNKEVFVETQSIAFATDTVYDSSKMQGFREVRTAGKPGKRVVTFEIVRENGKEVSRKKIQDVVSSKPARQVVVVGTKQPDSGSNVALGQRLAAGRGWTGSQWSCLYDLWQKESNWNHLAENPSSGAYGIAQSLPASKMASHGADYRSNPATQIKWGMDYIATRYGSPCEAVKFWQNNNWY